MVRNKPSPSIPQASPLLYVVGLDATPTICPTVYMGWGGVGMFTFLRPRSLDLAQDLHAMLAWVGVGWGCSRSFDHIPSTLHKMFMLRSHGVGWGGVGMLTFLRPRSLALAKDVDAVLKWVRWGGALLRFTRPFARLWCCAQDHDAAYPWCWYIYIYDSYDCEMLMMMTMIPSNCSRRGANGRSWSYVYHSQSWVVYGMGFTNIIPIS